MLKALYKATTKEALDASIEKWRAIVAGAKEDQGPRDCALCALFNQPHAVGGECEGCPVRDETGQGGCGGTPYVEFRKASKDRRASNPQALEAAVKELQFLIGLRQKVFPAADWRNATQTIIRAWSATAKDNRAGEFGGPDVVYAKVENSPSTNGGVIVRLVRTDGSEVEAGYLVEISAKGLERFQNVNRSVGLPLDAAGRVALRP